MVLKKIHLGDAVFSVDSASASGAAGATASAGVRVKYPLPQTHTKRIKLLNKLAGISDVRRLVASEFQALSSKPPQSSNPSPSSSPAGTAWGSASGGSVRSAIATRVHNLVMALALCHRFVPPAGTQTPFAAKALNPFSSAPVSPPQPLPTALWSTRHHLPMKSRS